MKKLSGKIMFKNKKKLILIISASAVVLLALIGYFVITPIIQVNSYKQDLTAQEKISSAFNAVPGISISSSSSSISTADAILVLKSEAKNGKEKVKDLESAIATYSQKLTSFSSLPLLDVNAYYKNAASIKAKEQEYLKSVQDYIAESNAVFDYEANLAAFTDKYKDFDQITNNIGSATTKEELIAQLDAAIAKIDAMVNDLASTSAPETFKNMHDTQLTSIRSLVALFKDLRAAVSAEDLNRINNLSTELNASSDKLSESMFNSSKDILDNSKLLKLKETVKQQQRDLTAAINNL